MKRLILVCLLGVGLSGCATNGRPIDWSPMQGYFSSINQQNQQQVSTPVQYQCESVPVYSYGEFAGTRTVCQ